MEKKRKINWTAEERTLVFNWAFDHRNDYKGKELLHAAQIATLPQDRRRVIWEPFSQEMRNYITTRLGLPLVKKPQVKKRTDKVQKLVEPQPQFPTYTQEELDAADKRAEERHKKLYIVDAWPIEGALTTIALHLLDNPAVQDKIQQLILRTLQNQKEKEETHVPSGVPFPTHLQAEGKKRLSFVLIVGLRGSQVTEIKRDFEKCLSIKFWDASKSMHALRKVTTGADIVVVFANFISHAATQVIATRNKNVHTHHGGITGLKTLLERVVIEGPTLG